MARLLTILRGWLGNFDPHTSLQLFHNSKDPQLGGAIDTYCRFSVFFGTGLDKRVAYSAVYKGLEVAATWFVAHVLLDLLDGAEQDETV